jgi:hypothetical protein
MQHFIKMGDRLNPDFSSCRLLAAGILALLVWLLASPAFGRSVETGVFEFSNWEGPSLKIYYAEPDDLADDAPIIIVLHGASRNPDDYRDNWIDLAEQYGFAVYAPGFSRADFPKAKDYNLGGLSNEAGRAFDAVEPLFDHLRARRGVSNSKYYLFGHSAGAQFVHRFVYFKAEARYEQAYAANAGWYTLPNRKWDWPYGLKGAPGDPQDMRAILASNLVLLLGDQDIDPESYNLRQTREAKAQGPHRLARGTYFLKTGLGMADKLGVPFGWKFKMVEGVGHDNGGMAEAAAVNINLHHIHNKG